LEILKVAYPESSARRSGQHPKWVDEMKRAEGGPANQQNDAVSPNLALQSQAANGFNTPTGQLGQAQQLDQKDMLQRYNQPGMGSAGSGIESMAESMEGKGD
jgi:hypothetical protein